MYCHLFQSLILIWLCTLSAISHGQLCTGSLGDPAANITFGSGPNPGPPLPVGKTSYQYANNACPVNGDYTILNRGVECNYDWHVLPSDHSGMPGGYFMLVDASFEPGDFYVDTVTTLCVNTTYEFAAWMLNMKKVLQGTRPNITFSIETSEGVVLKTYNTGDIPVENVITWKQYGFYFTTPEDVSKIVLRMRNNAPGGHGNDLAIDDITFRPCGTAITASIEANRDTVNVCEGVSTSYIFTGTAPAYESPAYQWQVSLDSGTHWADIQDAISSTFNRQPTGVGAYWYRLSVSEQDSASNTSCRIFSNLLYVNVHGKPYVNAGVDRIVFSNDTIILRGEIEGEDPKWYWDPPDYLSDRLRRDPVASPEKDMQYTLLATTAFGCSNRDAVAVKVIADIFVPTAFTPNNDGKNDRWQIAFHDPLLGATVKVYNRYGQLVYQAAGTATDWDGNVAGMQQASGAYVYVIQFNKRSRILKGTLLLIR